MNRFFRRMKRFGKSRTEAEPGPQGVRQPGMTDAATPQDVTSARAKNTRHGKVTADKWNQ